MKIQTERVKSIHETTLVKAKLGRIELAKNKSDNAYDRTLEEMAQKESELLKS